MELQELFLQYTFDASLGNIFGLPLPSETSEYERKEEKKLQENMHHALFGAGRRAKIGLFRLLDPLTRPRWLWNYLWSCWDLHAYFDRVIADGLVKIDARNHQDEKEQGKASSEGNKRDKNSNILLKQLADVTRDKETLRWELSTALAGGRDTTGGLLAHVFWEMSRRPEIWARLQAEVDALGGRQPTHDDLRAGGLVYMKAVINECK